MLSCTFFYRASVFKFWKSHSLQIFSRCSFFLSIRQNTCKMNQSLLVTHSFLEQPFAFLLCRPVLALRWRSFTVVFSLYSEMTCGFLIQLVFCQKKRVHSLLKKILDPPLLINRWCCSGGSGVFNRYEKPMIAFTRNKFFYQNHRFTPLIKFDFLDFEKMTFLYSRKASFVFKTSLNIISGLILTEIEKKGFQDFKLPGSCC